LRELILENKSSLKRWESRKDGQDPIIPSGCVPRATQEFAVSSPESRRFRNRRECQSFLFLVKGSGRLYPGLSRSRISVLQPTIHHDGRVDSKNTRGRSRSAIGPPRVDQQAFVELSNGVDDQIPIFPSGKSNFRKRSRQDLCYPLGIAIGFCTSSPSLPVWDE